MSSESQKGTSSDVSFESVFKQWLSESRTEFEQDDDIESEEQEEVCSPAHETHMEELPEIEQETWKEDDMNEMPVLQKMVDLPRHKGRNLKSPTPPSLQKTPSFIDNRIQGKQSRHSEKNKITFKRKLKSRRVPVSDKNMCNPDMNNGQMAKESEKEGKNHRQCHSESSMSDMTDLSHSVSPTAPRGLEVDLSDSVDHSSMDVKGKSPHHCVGSKHSPHRVLSKSQALMLSPERDFPMEPDSTSEFLLGTPKWHYHRKECEARRSEVSPKGEVSPRSTGVLGPLSSGSGKSEMTVRVEENLAECDSTSMFMSSPSAISPASQGDIEERVCPILTDHEDGASPAHCVCRCQSLPPPTDLMPRDHVPITITSASSPNITITDRDKSVSKSWSPRVTCRNCLDDESAPDLEKVAPSLDLEADLAAHLLQSEHESPPVLTLSEQETRGKKFCVEHSPSRSVSSKRHQLETLPSLIKFGPDAVQTNKKAVSLGATFNESPPVLSISGLEASSRTSKEQTEGCSFSKNIDWETAVAETVESPPNLAKSEGDSKPGIILKIRTKTVMSQLEPVPEVKPPSSRSLEKRKRHTIDSPEMVSRLRKRQKSGESESATLPVFTEENKVQKLAEDCNNKNARSKADKCCKYSSQKNKRQRRNTVQLGGDLKDYVHNLSGTDEKFIISMTKLSRIQTQARDLLCCLFPRLQPQLCHISPESHRFMRVVEDMIGCLECCESEEAAKDCEELCELVEHLKLEGEQQDDLVPVFSPQVLLCSSPEHSLEEFGYKMCTLLQLLLPDLPVSLGHNLSQTSDELEVLMKRVIMANKSKTVKK